MPWPILPSRSPQPLQADIGAPKSACRPPANLPSTRIRARIIAPVTPLPPSPVLAPSIRGFGLNLLVEAGVLCRVLLEDGSLHYQLSHRGHHHHLICTDCGLTQDLLGCDIEGMLDEKAAELGFQTEGHRLEVYGRCYKCVPAEEAAD